jgi:hypothetical protein
VILDRRSLLAILASPMFLPVSGAIGAIPAAHVFSHASTRDIAADPTAHGRPLEIPLVDPAMPGVAVLIPVAQVPDALAKWESLTLRLPPVGRTPAGHDARVEWRVVDDIGDAQLVELQRVTVRDTHILRYRAADARVTLLTSRLFTRMHSFAGLAVGGVFATLVYVLARRAKRRLPPAPGVGKPARGFAAGD